MQETIKIYALRSEGELPEDVYQKLFRVISPEKKKKIQKFLNKEDALRCLLADAFTRYILINDFKINEGDIVFEYNDYGKPSLKTNNTIHFNASHSGEWIVGAFCKSPVGIDVEKITPIDFGIAEHYFTKKESKKLIALPHSRQLSFFYELWTLKESFVKQQGNGLSIPLNSFTVENDENGLLMLTTENERKEELFFLQYNLHKEYKMAVCALQNSFEDLKFILRQELVDYFC